MAKYAVCGKVVGSIYLGEFEADSEQEAIDKASEEASVRLCHQCSPQCEDPEVIDLVAEEIN